MELREFSPDDAGPIAAAVGIENAVAAVDSPWRHPITAYRFEMNMRHGWDGEPARRFLVVEDGAPVGLASLSTSEWDNLDLAWLDLIVHPDCRRGGVGSKALTALHDECRRVGRRLIGVDGWDSPSTRGFAAAVGYVQKSTEINRRQPLGDLSADFVAVAYAEAEAHASDYELLRIVGRSSAALHEELAVVAASINDAPLDDLAIEDEVFSAQRVRDFEHAQVESGHRLYRVVARHRQSGELAGHTVVTVDCDRPWIGTQVDTCVVAGHRGHRLGLLIKADLCRWLLDVEPQVRSLDTWNAESNDHMIGVNKRLAYEPLGRALAFQRRI